MKYMICFVTMFSSHFVLAEWKVPENADPSLILKEAEADAAAGRYQDALEKQLWFHQHALEFQPSLAGVRLSFALGDWYKLGKAYPAAMVKLRGIRDDAERRVLGQTGDVRDAFQDLEAINHKLGDDDRTVKVFVQLDRDSTQKATDVYDIAQQALIKAKNYSLCGKYLEPTDAFEEIQQLHQFDRKCAEEMQSPRLQRFEREHAEKVYIAKSH